MTDQPKRRPLFQLHLSTCIVLMFVAGALMWANMRRSPRQLGLEMTNLSGGTCSFGSIRSYGWPFTALQREQILNGEFDDFIQIIRRFTLDDEEGVSQILHSLKESPHHQEARNHWFPKGILLNALTAIGTLFFSAVAFEWFLRPSGFALVAESETRRALLRFRLSTCAAMFVTTGALVWLDTREHVRVTPNEGGVAGTECVREYGWPCRFHSIRQTIVVGDHTHLYGNGKIETGPSFFVVQDKGWPCWRYRGISIDALVLLFAVLITGVVTESALRFWERRP
ncbi:MAG TPA: hypothetical protein VGP72_12985 [Planctomycetota bacterium]|jgi:hypothetical protein